MWGRVSLLAAAGLASCTENEAPSGNPPTDEELYCPFVLELPPAGPGDPDPAALGGDPADCSDYPYEKIATGTMTWINNHERIFTGFNAGVSFEADGHTIRTLACSPAPADSKCWIWAREAPCQCWNIRTAWALTPEPITEPWWMDWSTFVGVQNAVGSAMRLKNQYNVPLVELILKEDATHEIDSQVTWYQPEQGELRAWAARDDGYWRLEFDLHWDP